MLCWIIKTQITVDCSLTATATGQPNQASVFARGHFCECKDTRRAPVSYPHVIQARSLKECDMCNICRALHADVTPYVFIWRRVDSLSESYRANLKIWSLHRPWAKSDVSLYCMCVVRSIVLTPPHLHLPPSWEVRTHPHRPSPTCFIHIPESNSLVFNHFD